MSKPHSELDMYDYWPCEVLDVHDGDTIKFMVDLGLETHRVIWVRLNNVWSPELSEPRGLECRNAVAARMEFSKWRVVTIKTGRSDKEKLSFIRYVANVFSPDMSFSLNAWIVESGFGNAE